MFIQKKFSVGMVSLMLAGIVLSGGSNHAEAAVTPNTPPSVPVLDGSTSVNGGSTYEYTMKSTDKENNKIRYEIVWSTLPTATTLNRYLADKGAYILDQNTLQTTSIKWPSVTNETIYYVRVRARDEFQAVSEWTTRAITVKPTPVTTTTATSTPVVNTTPAATTTPTSTPPVTTKPKPTKTPTAKTNSAPSAPVLGGPTTVYGGGIYEYTMKSTDDKKDKIRYEIVWNTSSTATELNQYLADKGLYTLAQNTLQIIRHKWPVVESDTTYYMRVRARDESKAVSDWTTRTITVKPSTPPSAPVLNGPISVFGGSTYDYTMKSTDKENDKIRYEVVFSTSSVATNLNRYLSAKGLYTLDQNTLQTTSIKWPAVTNNKNYYLRVRARDQFKGVSEWTTRTITVKPTSTATSTLR